jgi:protease I
MKKFVFVVAPKVFRDEEYIEPKMILEQAGIEVTTASTVIGELLGKIKIKAQSQILVKDISVKDFDGIFFVGGGGASVYFEDEVAHNIAKKFYDEGKIVSAICIAPVILAKAGLLNNKKATVFPDGADVLMQNGAIYTAKSVEVDGQIVTGNGPQAAKDFANELLKLL